jgi:hypothetical protein
MAKRKAAGRSRKAAGGRTRAAGGAKKKSGGAAKRSARAARRTTKAAKARKSTKPFGRPPARNKATRTKAARLDRERRILEEGVPTPPSSLDMNRRGTAARTGRAEMAETLEDHRTMAGLNGGDVDVNLEQAYFTGDEAPGGDNPTPDQDIVDDIGKALGVQYEDNEELRSSDKVTQRDKHRWELDPASSEDYKDRK